MGGDHALLIDLLLLNQTRMNCNQNVRILILHHYNLHLHNCNLNPHNCILNRHNCSLSVHSYILIPHQLNRLQNRNHQT
ncbi:unnamed protein product [Bursaphelenchus okinawaensis]|uniref:Uncharacterized protein n=1 Tax=Bursaphelenchus okinawaensis TaxID=465554 RepID=A0A811KI71_9BILA|nr:unnamed protein product [Bursaphelenchus okinawaensis]CAG9105126.1 unnamed protein product [Bursaphelenchus okinawaensis]